MLVKLMWFGSNTPVVRADPGDSLQFAVRQGRVSGLPSIEDHQRIDASCACAAFATES